MCGLVVATASLALAKFDMDGLGFINYKMIPKSYSICGSVLTNTLDLLSLFHSRYTNLHFSFKISIGIYEQEHSPCLKI